MRALAPALLLTLAVAGCTSTTSSSSSASKFSGTEADVAKVVEDLQTAGQRKDAAKVCSQLLAKSLVTKLDGDGTSCTQEMDHAAADADDFDLDVRDVTVSGDSATAKVQRGSDGPTATFTFVREANRWKIASL
jgi:uncharacterized protein YceK